MWRANNIITPLTHVTFVYNGPKGMVWYGFRNSSTHAIVEAAKAIGVSFKLVTLKPKTVREMTQLPRET